MVCLKDLAQELLLMLATDLRPLDLLSLALVARQFRDIAQELLHQHVKLSPLYKDRIQIFQLAGTLLRRPDLAQQTRSLQLTVSEACGDVPNDLKWVVDLGITWLEGGRSDSRDAPIFAKPGYLHGSAFSLR
jgi:hypothetical protein